ncbi:Z1 domain-containing protein [Acidaminococcus timonensis]|uniref:Z1 domain-containing protein n=1 Tax=Acidaminococcus timonensis TaxID=1871002 RepID=UPI002942AA10|nr:Z1 domain-containing protein [Acidaminococcus timonensis]
MISDLSGLKDYERLIYSGLVRKCFDLVKANIPIKDAVKKILLQSKEIVSDPKFLEKVLLQEVSQEHSIYPIITNQDARNRHWWNDFKTKNENLQYWTRYHDYLLSEKNWSEIAVEDLDASTDEVLNQLSNPLAKQPEERRGLVYGAVQSGKTGHYIGLINKAFCAGYKIIIVLSGMQNSLRSQTQARIDEEVLGFETSNDFPNNELNNFQQVIQNSIGVGKVVPTAEITTKLQSLTNRDEHGDFNTANSHGGYLPPFIIITKKNKSPLTNIISSLKSSTLATKHNNTTIISRDYPALIIDDEADQASINTHKLDPSVDPTTINATIRQLLNLFECKSYVGYTATPFANIFIPPKTNDKEYGKDLFPDDFIAKTPCPQQYIGAKEFFGLYGEEGEAMPLIRTINEEEVFLPQGTKKNDPVGELPEKLKDAIKYFFISTAIRNLRGQQNKPNTMLIHIVRFIGQQEEIKRKISRFKDDLVNKIVYRDKDEYTNFKRIYDEDYIPTTDAMNKKYARYMNGCSKFSFDLIWKEIQKIAKKINIFSVNGKSKDALIYKKQEGKPFNVIVIGGDKLSRGLTLEGLTISYFTRNAGAMDTLMQMGRWFGYRPGYIDVCRLFTTSELSTKFEIVSYSAADLASQFDDMNAEGSDPKHFGLKVASNPNIMISARNKIRTGEDYKADFSSGLTQTRLMDADTDSLESNYNAVDTLLSSLDDYRLDVPDHRTYFEMTGRKKPAGKTFWHGVPGIYIANFFDHYRTSKAAAKANSKHIADYIREMNRYGGLTNWTICLADVNRDSIVSKIATGSAFPIGIHGITRNNKGNNTVVNKNTRDLHVIISAGDDNLDLTQKELEQANQIRENLKNNIKDNQVISKRIRSAIRQFDHGFLLLYPLKKVAKNIELTNGKTPYGFAVVFPDRKDKGNLKSYRLNEVAVELDDE